MQCSANCDQSITPMCTALSSVSEVALGISLSQLGTIFTTTNACYFAELGCLAAGVQLQTPSNIPPPQAQNILFPVTENVTNAINNLALTTSTNALWHAAQFPGGCTCNMTATNFTTGSWTSLATWQITGNSSLYSANPDYMDNLELSELPAWYLPAAPQSPTW